MIRLRNDGDEPATVSSRLNLFEGDLLVRCTRPDDRTLGLSGVASIDSFLRQTELRPGQRLEAGLFLFYASEGLTFDDPGPYRLSVEYHPGGGRDPIETDPSQVRVTEPTTEAARDLASLTTAADVGRTVALGGMDADEETIARLGDLVERFPDNPEGIVARLVLAAVDDGPAPSDASLRDAFEARDPTTIAHWMTAITTPLDGRSDVLTDAFRTYLDDEIDEPTATRAKRIVAGEPL